MRGEPRDCVMYSLLASDVETTYDGDTTQAPDRGAMVPDSPTLSRYASGLTYLDVSGCDRDEERRRISGIEVITPEHAGSEEEDLRGQIGRSGQALS